MGLIKSLGWMAANSFFLFLNKQDKRKLRVASFAESIQYFFNENHRYYSKESELIGLVKRLRSFPKFTHPIDPEEVREACMLSNKLDEVEIVYIQNAFFEK